MTYKNISVCRDCGSLVTFWFQCAVYKLIYLLTYILQCTEMVKDEQYLERLDEGPEESANAFTST